MTTRYVSPRTITYASNGYGFVHEAGLWEDLRFPAVGINPPGGDDAPSRNTTDGLLAFSKSANNIIAIQAQMPHMWKSGTNIAPHIHIVGVNAPGETPKTRWQMSYKIMDVGDSLPASYTVSNVDANISALDDGKAIHQIISFPEIAMTGHQDSCMLVILVQRSAGDTTNDTYDDVIKLLEFDIHYLQNTMGSIVEYGDNY